MIKIKDKQQERGFHATIKPVANVSIQDLAKKLTPFIQENKLFFFASNTDEELFFSTVVASDWINKGREELLLNELKKFSSSISSVQIRYEIRYSDTFLIERVYDNMTEEAQALYIESLQQENYEKYGRFIHQPVLIKTPRPYLVHGPVNRLLNVQEKAKQLCKIVELMGMSMDEAFEKEFTLNIRTREKIIDEIEQRKITGQIRTEIYNLIEEIRF